MDFGKILTRSWEIIWTHKSLWIFGMLAAFGGQVSGFGGRGNVSMDASNSGELPQQFERFAQNWQRGLEQFINDSGGILFIVGLVCLGLLLAALFWAIGVYGRVGLIKGVLNAEDGRPVGFRAVAHEAWPMLGSALGLNFILAVLPLGVFILLLVAAIPIAIGTLGIGLLCFIPLICLFIPIAIGYGVYIEMANLALVQTRRGVGAALTHGWEVFRDNLGSLAGMAVILIFGGILVGAVLSAPLLAIMTPVFMAMMSNDPQAAAPAFMTTGVLLLIAIPIYILLGGIIRSYVQSAWTLTYLQLAPSPKKPKVKAKTTTRK